MSFNKIGTLQMSSLFEPKFFMDLNHNFVGVS